MSYLSTSFAILGISFLLFPASANAQVRLRVCNDGKIPVYAAVVSERGLIWPLQFHGWKKIETDNRNFLNSCWPFFIGSARVNRHYILFGIYDRDNRFGVVVYTFKSRDGIADQEFCVPAPGKKASDCRKAPVSSWVQPNDSREIDFTLNVKPDIDDKIAVYLEHGKESWSPRAPTNTGKVPPPKPNVPPKPKLDEIRARNKAQDSLDRSKLNQACLQAHQRAANNEERATYCQCVTDALLPSSDSADRAALLQDWGFISSIEKRPYYAEISRMCPPVPPTPKRVPQSNFELQMDGVYIYYRNEGFKALARARFNDALKNFDQCLRLERDASAHAGRAIAQFFLGKRDGAWADSNEALSTRNIPFADPVHKALAYEARAHVYVRAGDTRQAIEDYLRSWRIRTSNGTHSNEGYAKAFAVCGVGGVTIEVALKTLLSKGCSLESVSSQQFEERGKER